MRPNILYTSLIVGAVVGVTYTSANADLPDDQIIELRIRETPSDPESVVIFSVKFELTATDSDGGKIGWEVTEVVLEDSDSEASPLPTWSDPLPAVDTPDGLWWVEHDDPMDPEASEFASVPYIEGLADATDPQDDDLEYELEGDFYAGGAPPYEVTSSGTAYSIRQMAQEPEVDIEDEPVEIDPETDTC